MKRCIRIKLRAAAAVAAFVMAMTGGCDADVYAAGPGWEHTSQAAVSDVPASADAPALADVSARGGYIYVTVIRAADVRIENILGQTVSTQTLQRGTSRLRIPQRGMYIVRVENVSRRIRV